MKSGKQRRAEIRARRERRARSRAERVRAEAAERPRETPPGAVPANPELLAPFNSYGVPRFVERGFYLDVSFDCIGCGKPEIWTAAQQKWWFEVAKGYAYSTARRCRACRRRERERREAARRIHLEGVARKRARS
jgi:hypothetical protein